MKLDGGIDLNGQAHRLGDPRDHPPGIFYDAWARERQPSMDLFLGYEQATLQCSGSGRRSSPRRNPARNTIGSAGAETYVGDDRRSTGFTVNLGSGSERLAATYTAAVGLPRPQQITDSNQRAQRSSGPPRRTRPTRTSTVWVKIGYGCDVNRVYVYYTTDGQTWPEGAGGVGGRQHEGRRAVLDDQRATTATTIDWWARARSRRCRGQPSLRYKIGATPPAGAGLASRVVGRARSRTATPTSRAR